MKKIYSLISGVKCLNCIKHSIAIIACFLCLQVHAQYATSLTICPGSSATLTAPPGTGAIRWYTQQFDGTAIASGQSYTTGILTQSVSYWYQYGEESFTRKQATVTVKTLPASSFTALPGCVNSTVDFTPNTISTGTLLSCNGAYGAAVTGIVPITATDNIEMSMYVLLNSTRSVDQFLMYNGNAGSSGYGIMVKANTGKLNILLGGVVEITTDVVLQSSQWIRLSVTRTSGVWQLNYNGTVYTPAANATATPRTPAGGFYIGSSNSQSVYFNGAIDEVAINAINTSYHNWSFNETNGGTIVKDGSGNNFDLTLNNAAAVQQADASYRWQMGGIPVIGFKPNYSFNSAGNKTVSLTVVDLDGCTLARSSQTVNINTVVPPAVTAFALADSLCAGMPVTLGVTGGGIVLSQDFNNANLPGWTVDGGWQFNEVGYKYDINSATVSVSPHGNVTVGTIKFPAFSTVGLTGMQVAINHYLAYPGAVASIQMSLNGIAWTTVKAFDVNGRGSYNNFVTDYVVVPAAFENKPVVYIKLLFSEPNTGDYDAVWAVNYVRIITGSTLPTYRWASDDPQFTSKDQNLTVTPGQTTTYTVYASTGCTSAPGSVTVHTKTLPTATVAISGTPAMCAGTSNTSILFKGGGGLPDYTFTYTLNGVQNTTPAVTATQGYTITAPTGAAGNFVYTLQRVSSSNGCAQDQAGSVTTTVYPVPNATISLLPSTCLNTPVQATVTGSGSLAPYSIGVKQQGNNPVLILTTNALASPVQFNVATNTTGTKVFDVVDVTDARGCVRVSPASAQIITYAPPTIGVTSSADKFCGDSLTLTATGATSYSWSPGLYLSAYTGGQVKAAPPLNTTYTITGTANGCSSNGTIAVVSAPLKLTASSSDSSICFGGAVNLTAAPVALPRTLFSETFNSTLPGWMFVNTSSGGGGAAITAAGWLGHVNGYTFAAANTDEGQHTLTPGSGFYMSNAQAILFTRTSMQSPAFSTVGLRDLKIVLNDQVNFRSTGTSSINVQVSIDGTNWTDVSVRNIKNYPNTTEFLSHTFNIPVALENQPVVYIRFKYDTTVDDWWAIDDVKVTGVGVPTSWSWSSSPAGFTSALQNPGPIVPAVNTIYSVTATSAEGCVATVSTKPVTVKTPVAFTTPAVISVPAGATPLSIPYAITNGAPTTYSVVPGVPAMPGFVPVAKAALTANPLSVPVPAGAPGTYNFTVTLSDSALACITPYSTTIQVAAMPNNRLASLSINTGVLSPAFNADTAAYAVSLPLTVASVTLTATAQDATAIIKINGVVTASGSASKSIALTGAINIIKVGVTAQDNTVKTYTVTVIKPALTNITGLSTDVKVAYSLRKLGGTYLHAAVTPPAAVAGFTNAGTPLIRVRRSTDNTMLDIGYTASGNLDTVTLKAFTGTASGYVAIWFDQSGQNYDAVQTATIAQPRIVNAGVVERKNSLPAVYFYGSAPNNNVYLATVPFTGLHNGFSLFTAAGVKKDTLVSSLITKTDGNVASPWDVYQQTYVIGYKQGNVVYTDMPKAVNAANGFAVWGFTGDSINAHAYYNGEDNGIIPSTAGAYLDGNTPLTLGSKSNLGTQLNGWISEALLFPSVLGSDERAAVTKYQKDIYLAPIITSFTPLSASPAATATITITGSNFTGATAVSFGGISAASFTVVNDNTVVATVTNAAPGDVMVTTPLGTGTKAGFFYALPPGNALNFDGVNDAVFIPYNAALNAPVITVEVWVKPTSTGNGFIVAKANSRGISGAYFEDYFINISNGRFAATMSYNSVQKQAVSSPFTAGKWYHVAAVYSATSVSIYLNGVLQQTTPTGFAMDHAQQGIYLAAHPNSSVHTGLALDELRVFNTDRSAQVPADMVNTLNPVTEPGLVAYYNFDQGIAGDANPDVATLMDLTTTGLNATLSNFALAGATSNWLESYAMVVPKPYTTNLTALSYTVSWIPGVFGIAESYLLDTSSKADFAIFSTIPVTGASVTVTGLATGRQVYYRLRAEKASVTGQGAYSATVAVTMPVATISSFSPVAAPAGATITITGTGFTGATAVSFDGTPAASFKVLSDVSITAIVGEGATGSVGVTVAGGRSTKTGFTFLQVPVITSFTPTSGVNGVTVNITGSNFSGAVAVSFGGTPAASFTVISPTSIQAAVGFGASGIVSVTTPAGTGTKAGFTYVGCSPVTPAITIITNYTSPICTGRKVTFTATAVNAGAPVYQWYKNNTPAGTNSKLYVDSLLNNNDSIWCVVTASGSCLTAKTAKSNVFTYVVNAKFTPTLSIKASTSTTICNGVPVTFTATAANTGDSPLYQWKKNNVNIGTNSTTYTDAALQTGDSVWAVLTATAPCATPTTVTSAKLKFTVNPVLTPTVSIIANYTSPICTGRKVTFTATAVNAGAAIYQWYKNGGTVGANLKTYADSLLNNSDSIWCVATASGSCVTAKTVKSNVLLYAVNAKFTPTITIKASTGSTICNGVPVTFTAIAANTGDNPVCQWKKNNINIGANSSTYTDATLKTGDSVWVVLTVTAPCATPTTVTSVKLKFAVNPVLTPTVSIITNYTSPICTGRKVTFTATATNAGTPVYQWYKNNTKTGTNSKLYADSLINNNDSIWCVVTASGNCLTANTAKSNVFTYAVNPKLTPTLIIKASTSTTICNGTPVTFTATAGNTGASPVYQWKKNNIYVGANSTIYTDAALKTGDSVVCVLTVTAPCATPTTKTSASIKFIVNPVLTPTVSIITNYPSPICTGRKVTFTATAANAGTPVYQWYKNNTKTGTNSKLYADSLINNNDSIWCVVTASGTCLTANTAKSNVFTYAVNPKLTPTLTIKASTSTTICNGVPVTFTATAANTGADPVYQWKKNNINVGINSTTYTHAALKTGDSVWVVLTVTAPCATPTTVTSAKLKFTANPVLTPSVSIITNYPSPICTGRKVTFTATAVNAGTPVYQWYKNNKTTGTNNKLYADSLINNNDSIWCVVTVTGGCVTANTAKSNVFTYAVNPKLTPAISITANTVTSICKNTNVTFTATVASAGSSFQYQWKKNGINVGTNTGTYADGQLNNNDTVYCVLTVTSPCATTTTVTSNKIKFTVAAAVPAVLGIIKGTSPVQAGQANLTYYVTKVDGIEYNWTVPAGVTIVSGQGTYAVVVNWGASGGTISVTASNSCGVSAAVQKAVTITAGFVAYNPKDPSTWPAYVKLYPNPATSIVTVEFNAATEDKYEAQLVTSLGQVLQSKASASVKGINTVSFDVTKYASAMYYIRLLDKAYGVRTLKVIKAK